MTCLTGWKGGRELVLEFVSRRPVYFFLGQRLLRASFQDESIYDVVIAS